MTVNHYFKWLASSCLTVLLLAGIFNYIIDPYNIFQSITLQDINTSKPATSNRTGLAKTYMVNKTAAETLFIGTSKFDVGLDPESKNLPASYKPAFNLAVPGADIYRQYRYIQHATANHKPDLILMSLEFEFFISQEETLEPYPPNREPQGYEKRLNVDSNGEANPGKSMQHLKDVSASLFSNTAIYDSIRTMLAGKQSWISASGLSSGSARFGSEVKAKGHFSIFRDTIKNQLKGLPGARVNPDSNAFKALQDTIKYCNDNSIKLVIILPPYHVFQYELWDRFSLWQEFENWKNLIVQTVAATGSADDIPVWDFATYNSKTTEHVPAPLNTAIKMQWYWEPAHFKAALGDQILNDVLSSGRTDFATLLSIDSIDRQIKNNREKQLIYRQNNKEQLELFDLIVPVLDETSTTH